MNRASRLRSCLDGRDAFSRRELVIVLAALVLLGLLLLPHLRGNRAAVVRSSCIHRLKHVGLAFSLWAGSHRGLYPMQSYTNEPGALAGSNTSACFMTFQAMSNELQVSSVVYCPSDKQRRFATNFAGDFNDSRVSFYIGLDANRSLPASFLAGDRNISGGASMETGILNLSASQSPAWTPEMHNGFGNVVRVDGSVSGFTTRQLRKALSSTGLGTNRLVLP